MPQVSREVREFDLDKILALTPEQLAYMAGYFDGEGSLGLYKKRRDGVFYAVSTRVTITQLTDDVLRDFFDAFGGALILMDRPERKESKHTRYWSWSCDHQSNARMLVKTLMPYLREKRAEAELMLHYLDNVRSLTLEDKEAICDQIADLKKRQHDEAA